MSGSNLEPANKKEWNPQVGKVYKCFFIIHKIAVRVFLCVVSFL